ncbi:NHL repeat-containing protein [Aquimarina pacifica]|uniref:hypothetical protein n=1 Tax=Aquimarina pacifica TaxID=1296415 RepID=UPI00046F24FA|nr:hypothetical protein [Aquimarina pacifica]
MKTFFTSVKTKVVLFLMTFALLVVSVSCHGDPVYTDPEVKTLVSDFDANEGVSVDRQGNIYASNFGQFDGATATGSGTTLLKATRRGEVVTYATELGGPVGNAIDSKGNVYVVNFNTKEIIKITQDGSKTVFATIEGYPTGVAIDKFDNVYVSNIGSYALHKVTPEGEVTEFANDTTLGGGVGMDFDSKGNLIVANQITGEIVSIDPEGTISLIVQVPDLGEPGLRIGHCTIINDIIYGTGMSVHKIFSVTLDGEVNFIAGTGEAGFADGPLLEASFDTPNGIAADKRKKILYITEYGNTTLRKIKLY